MTVPDPWTREEIDALLELGEIDDLRIIPIAVTCHGSPDPDWSETICLRLAGHPDVGVRGNAILGLGHLARSERRLHRDAAVAAVALGLRDRDPYVRGHAESAGEDIEHFLRWRVPPWDDLYAQWHALIAARSPEARSVGKQALRRIRGLTSDDLLWLEGALEHAERRWFVARLFARHPLPKRLFSPMMLSALDNTDASDVQQLVEPCVRSFGREAVLAWLDRADAARIADARMLDQARYKATQVTPRNPAKREARRSPRGAG